MTTDQLSTPETVRADETSGTGDITIEADDTELLFRSEDRIRFNRRWRDLQSHFIDDPRQAVDSADRLLVDVMDHLADRVVAHRWGLAQPSDGNGTADTEDLRLAMQRYRALCHRLLSA